MIRRIASALAAAGLLAACGSSAASPRQLPAFDAPEPARWINSEPLTTASLRGRPVLVEFWAFGCSNCRNTLPWLKQVADRYSDQGFAIVAVHTPEFASERGRPAVARAVERLGIRYPVLIDDDSRFWSAMSNRYWPAFYLVDARGRVVLFPVQLVALLASFALSPPAIRAWRAAGHRRG